MRPLLLVALITPVLYVLLGHRRLEPANRQLSPFAPRKRGGLAGRRETEGFFRGAKGDIAGASASYKYVWAMFARFANLAASILALGNDGRFAQPCRPRTDLRRQFHMRLSQQHLRVREFLNAQNQRLSHAQADLSSQVEQFLEELDRNRAETALARQELDQRAEELKRQGEHLNRLDEELQRRQADWEALQNRTTEANQRQNEELRARQADWEELQKRTTETNQRRTEELRARQADWEALQNRTTETNQRRTEELCRQQEALAERQAALDQRRIEIDRCESELNLARQKLALVQEEHEAGLRHATTLSAQLEQRLSALAADQEEVVAAKAHAESQRRRIAEEFRQQRAALLRELDRRRTELDRIGTGETGRLQSEIEGAIAVDRAASRGVGGRPRTSGRTLRRGRINPAAGVGIDRPVRYRAGATCRACRRVGQRAGAKRRGRRGIGYRKRAGQPIGSRSGGGAKREADLARELAAAQAHNSKQDEELRARQADWEELRSRTNQDYQRRFEEQAGLVSGKPRSWR